MKKINLIKLGCMVILIPFILMAETHISVSTDIYNGEMFSFDNKNDSASIHNIGSSAAYFTFIIEKDENISVRGYLDGVEFLGYALKFYLIEGDDRNGTLIADITDKTFIHLEAGTYTLEVSPVDSNAVGIGEVSVLQYRKPTRWPSIDYKKELYSEPINISKEHLSVHREGSYALYYTLIIKENAYISISTSLFDIEHPERQADSYVYLIKGEEEHGKVLSEGVSSLTQALDRGKYTIEITTKEPGIEMPGDMFVAPAVPVSIINSVILE